MKNLISAIITSTVCLSPLLYSGNSLASPYVQGLPGSLPEPQVSSSPTSYLQWREEDKTYKLVCDPSSSAAFLRGLTGKPQCAYVEIRAVQYMLEREKPCDETFTGQFLRGLLGQACETTKRLMISDADYTRFRKCDEAFWNLFMAGLLSRDPCEYKFEEKTK